MRVLGYLELIYGALLLLLRHHGYIHFHNIIISSTSFDILASNLGYETSPAEIYETVLHPTSIDVSTRPHSYPHAISTSAEHS
ncbi:hypothetical protein BofuT4_uP037940.1 [Botrytis cinerea T4]|uniref:Uncharacterized protein n=1 Tax=Botryotinia fuckeliana (strain T4) TaxID=999810 RepID=G2Y574_BOTF4|nr:hypothetical protein BofuT4_uP037940.1 [Botrytis cinerea T4]